MKDNKMYFKKMIEYIDKTQAIIENIDFETFVSIDEKNLACAFAIGQKSP